MVQHILGQRVSTTAGYRIYDQVALVVGRIADGEGHSPSHDRPASSVGYAELEGAVLPLGGEGQRHAGSKDDRRLPGQQPESPEQRSSHPHTNALSVVTRPRSSRRTTSARRISSAECVATSTVRPAVAASIVSSSARSVSRVQVRRGSSSSYRGASRSRVRASATRRACPAETPSTFTDDVVLAKMRIQPTSRACDRLG